MTTAVADRPGWVGRAQRGELPPGAALPVTAPTLEDLFARTEAALEGYPRTDDGTEGRFVAAVRAAIAEARADLA